MNNCLSNEMKRYNHLVGEINAVYHEISLNLGLSDSAMVILYSICDNGDSCLLQEISRRSGVSKQTINSAIRKLEKEGIIKKKSCVDWCICSGYVCCLLYLCKTALCFVCSL